MDYIYNFLSNINKNNFIYDIEIFDLKNGKQNITKDESMLYYNNYLDTVHKLKLNRAKIYGNNDNNEIIYVNNENISDNKDTTDDEIIYDNEYTCNNSKINKSIIISNINQNNIPTFHKTSKIFCNNINPADTFFTIQFTNQKYKNCIKNAYSVSLFYQNKNDKNITYYTGLLESINNLYVKYKDYDLNFMGNNLKANDLFLIIYLDESICNQYNHNKYVKKLFDTIMLYDKIILSFYFSFFNNNTFGSTVRYINMLDDTHKYVFYRNANLVFGSELEFISLKLLFNELNKSFKKTNNIFELNNENSDNILKTNIINKNDLYINNNANDIDTIKLTSSSEQYDNIKLICGTCYKNNKCNYYTIKLYNELQDETILIILFMDQ